MEWVEVTAKTVESAKDLALDRLGISAEDAEFDVVEEPRPGLFGRIRGEARVRARVKPTMVRQKQDRRGRRQADGGNRPAPSAVTAPPDGPGAAAEAEAIPAPSNAAGNGERQRRRRSRGPRNGSNGSGGSDGSGDSNDPATSGAAQQGGEMDEESEGVDVEPVPVEDVRAAAEGFAQGLVEAFGLKATTSSQVDGSEIEVRIDTVGDGLGLLIGPSGRTLLAIQDLARVAAQRRLGDHDTRLRIDVAGYREKRRAALERFAREVADLVKQSGVARSLEPMPSSDRKVVHDTLTTIDGVVSRSEGEDPYRRIIVSPG
jgi:spoIIIJ-associated protein